MKKQNQNKQQQRADDRCLRHRKKLAYVYAIAKKVIRIFLKFSFSLYLNFTKK